MGETKCYAMVRGSAIRVTGLGPKGSIPEPIQFAVSKSVAKVQINEVTESGSDELLGSDDSDNDKRLRFVRPEQTVNYNVDIDFLRVDPGVLSLITGVPLIYKGSGLGFGRRPFGDGPFGGIGIPDGPGFGEVSFGEASFGGSPGENSPVVGFDSDTRRPPVSFALEVWSKLAGRACDGAKQYGYTVFPYLKGGRLIGFEFKNGLVSFNIRGAQTRKGSRWAVGPYDLEGTHERLVEPVSRNTLFRQTLTTAVPPTEVAGVQETWDRIIGGSASVTSDDIISGGTAASTSPWIISGGRAV